MLHEPGEALLAGPQRLLRALRSVMSSCTQTQ